MPLFFFVGLVAALGAFGLWWFVRRRASRSLKDLSRGAPENRTVSVEAASSRVAEKEATPSERPIKSSRFASSLASWWTALREPSVDTEQWERLFIESDFGTELSKNLLQTLSTHDGTKSPEGVLKFQLSQALEGAEMSLENWNAEPCVILVVGINGAGKTTSVVKLGNYFKSRGLSVAVVGADTFRKAAQEQLQRGCEKANLEFFTILGPESSEGADPSSIIFDGLKKFSDRNIVLVDTSGRLHTKVNLMEELKKMKRVAMKAAPQARLMVWMVVDATLGQNSIAQAKTFHEAMELSGLIVTKMDGLSRGGTIFRLFQELHVPILFLGLGESSSDLEIFKRDAFIEELFDHEARSF